MASSLGYVLMNWTSEFARHSKAKKSKKNQKNKENVGVRLQNINHTDELKNQISNSALNEFKGTEKREVEIQTEDFSCQGCEDYKGNVEYLEQQLSDVHITQESLKQKLFKTKATLAATIERESRLRDTKESLELEEAQVRYEFEDLKAGLLRELEERDIAHSERIQLMEKVMNEKDCAWASKNEQLQKELRNTLGLALQENEREECSLTSLEQEINSLRSVIDMRSSENKELRTTNETLNDKIEHHAWLEAELEKAKRRLEELALIVQNKMISERELLELSEALQRDLVQSRAETLHYKHQIENRQYLQDHNERNLQLLHKVKHSQSDLFNNQLPMLVQPQSQVPLTPNVLPPQLGSQIINNDISKESTFLGDKPSNLQKLTNWVDEEYMNEKGNNLSEKRLNNNDEINWSDKNDPNGNNSQFDHRNQHQKASYGSDSSSPCISSEENDPSLVVDVREKTESVAWVIQMPPSPNTANNLKRTKRN